MEARRIDKPHAGTRSVGDRDIVERAAVRRDRLRAAAIEDDRTGGDGLIRLIEPRAAHGKVDERSRHLQRRTAADNDRADVYTADRAIDGGIDRPAIAEIVRIDVIVIDDQRTVRRTLRLRLHVNGTRGAGAIAAG